MSYKPLKDGEGPCNYVAGWNMPGYLPVSDPECFASFDEAKAYIVDSIKSHEEDCAIVDEEDLATSLCHLAEDVNLESGPFETDPVDNTVYWVSAMK